MKFLGLVALYVLGTFLIGYLILIEEKKGYGLSKHFYLYFRFNEKAQFIVIDIFVTKGRFQPWLYQPFGMVRYNSIILLDFFDYGK